MKKGGRNLRVWTSAPGGGIFGSGKKKSKNERGEVARSRESVNLRKESRKNWVLKPGRIKKGGPKGRGGVHQKGPFPRVQKKEKKSKTRKKKGPRGWHGGGGGGYWG